MSQANDDPRPEALTFLRFARGLTQAQLAQRAKVSRETISRLERGATPRLTTARALASALDVPLGAIFPTETLSDGR